MFLKNSIQKYRVAKNERRLKQFKQKCLSYGLKLGYTHLFTTAFRSVFHVYLDSTRTDTNITFVFPQSQFSTSNTAETTLVINRIQDFLYTMSRISEFLPVSDKPIVLTVNDDNIHGSLYLNNQKYQLKFCLDERCPSDMFTIDITSPLHYDPEQWEHINPIITHSPSCTAHLLVTQTNKPCTYIRHFVDTDYEFPWYSREDFVKALDEVEKARIIFTHKY